MHFIYFQKTPSEEVVFEATVKDLARDCVIIISLNSPLINSSPQPDITEGVVVGTLVATPRYAGNPPVKKRKENKQ